MSELELCSFQLTISRYDASPGKVRLVANDNHRLVLGIALPPQIIQDVLGDLEAGSVNYRVHDHTGVRLVRGQGVFNLRNTFV